MKHYLQATGFILCMSLLAGGVAGAANSGSESTQGFQRCDQARTELEVSKCADPSLFERESARLADFYLHQAVSQPFFDRVEQGRDLADRFTAAVVALNLENNGAGETASARQERTDRYWHQLAEQHPQSLAVQIGRFGYCALRETADCTLAVAQSLNQYLPDNAWGPLLLGVAHWDSDRDQARRWLHKAGQRPNSDLGVWQSVLLIEQSLRRHLQPAHNDPLNHTPAALLETAMAIQAASLPLHLPIQQACNESEVVADLEACLSAAGALAGAQDLILTRMVGLAMSARLLDRLNRHDEADAAREHQLQLQDWARSSLARGPAFIDAEAGLRYLQSCAQIGELNALTHYLAGTFDQGQ